jgi:hypothetical protein
MYIQHIEQHPQDHQATTFQLTESKDNAWFWKTEGEAAHAIEVWKQSGAAGGDFHVEARPQGGFLISCEQC